MTHPNPTTQLVASSLQALAQATLLLAMLGLSLQWCLHGC